MKGPSDEANALAVLLREWLDGAGLRLDDLMGKLTPDHFENATVPARSTVSDRLAGVNLRWDFVEAVADVCFSDQAECKRRTGAARPLFDAAERAKRSGSALRAGQQPRPKAATPSRAVGSPAVAAELIHVQRQSLAMSDQLLRALQRTAELEKARNDANQMVLILLALVDKLQRDIATLTASQRSRAAARTAGRDVLDEVHEKLRHSETQRTQAEAELARARAEREKADRLAEQSAEQVRRLTEELARLRSVHADPTAGPEVPEADLPAVSPMTPGTVPDDIDIALMKASRILDNGAERLEQLAEELEELREEPDGLSGPDNPLTGDDTSGGAADNSGVGAGGGMLPRPVDDPASPPDNTVAGQTWAHDPIVDRIRAVVDMGLPVDRGWLRLLGRDAEPDRFVMSLGSLRAAGAIGPAVDVLFEAGAGRPADSLAVVLSLLSPYDMGVVTTGIGAERRVASFHQTIAQLRAAGFGTVAGMALAEAGRRRATSTLPLLLSPVRLGNADTVLVLKGVCARREDQIEEAARHLAQAGMRQEADIVRVAAVAVGSDGGWGHEAWFGDAPRARHERPRTDTVLTTRVRINIPGSRPQPPIVVRKPKPNG
ncbi:hypothetical protein GCM10017771_33880 [Streptomyces capitiformicae]|uniref:Uncharacterized protein n=1 Tax=Streptomyces capitiformicae TaxID=2014920 RepID=A0A919GPX4_9ACTN|nr:hypothetical protein [Streptomyces capitiformicae]GHH88461.1 hypothetical protein GCM10017771_33880 [Streptomyces capitiformicae]